MTMTTRTRRMTRMIRKKRRRAKMMRARKEGEGELVLETTTTTSGWTSLMAAATHRHLQSDKRLLTVEKPLSQRRGPREAVRGENVETWVTRGINMESPRGISRSPSSWRRMSNLEFQNSTIGKK